MGEEQVEVRVASQDCSNCFKKLRVTDASLVTDVSVAGGFSTLHKCRSSYYGVFGARIAIMLLLAILIGMVTIFTWHFTTIYATKSIKNLAYSLRVELLKRTISRSWNLVSSTLDATTTLVNLSDYMIAKHYDSGNASHQQHLVMRNLTWAVFASRQSVKSLSIVYKNGQLQAFDRNRNSNRTYFVFTTGSNSSKVTTLPATAFFDSVESTEDPTVSETNWFKEEVDPSSGNPIHNAVPIPAFDLTDHAGNLSELRTGQTYWHVTVGTNNYESLLSSASEVRHPVTNEVMATVVVTSALSGISSLMQDLALNYSGYFYLTSFDGLLLATSGNSSLTQMTPFGPKLLPAIQADDMIIRSGAFWLNANFGNRILAEKEVHAEDVVLVGEKFYIDSFFWNLSGLPLIGVVLLPRGYVLGEVDARGRTAVFVLVSAAIGILLVGCLFILVFTSGVSTEMKLREELINHLHARQRAEASSNYKSQFLANMSHELRTPMAAIIGLLDILLTDAYLSIDQTAIVSQIRHCSTALLRLLNNILDLSKVESGKLLLEKADFNLRHELEAVVDMFSVQCVDGDLDIILDLSDNIPQIVRGDMTRTVQIFANLIGNSIKFTSCISGSIVVRGWCEPFPANVGPFESLGSDGDKIALFFEVDDSGIGIDPGKWETVFDSFVQEDASTSRTHGGTGLGLCIVRSLVNKMGGEIYVAKKEGVGTLMRFFLLFDAPLEVFTPDNEVVASPCDSKVLIGMKGDMLQSSIVRWLSDKGIQTYATDDWDLLMQRLSSELSSTVDQLSKLLVILDTKLLPTNMEKFSEHLNSLRRFTERGAVVSWVLNHDTVATVKKKLREERYSIMASKPLYKSKLQVLLKSMVFGEHCFNEMPGLQWKDGPINLRESRHTSLGSIEFAQDTNTSTGNENPALERLSLRMDYILGEVANYKKPMLSESTGFSEEQSAAASRNVLGASGRRDTDSASASTSAQDDKVQTSRGVRSKSVVKSLAGLQILLAEDTPVMQKVATVLLKKLGASVMAVGDGQAAVQAWKESLTQETDDETITALLSSSSFDLILMDCQMPRMDGYDATTAIRQGERGSGQHIPIVALTAHAMSSDEERCLQVGMDAYLTKPIDCKHMANTILSLTMQAKLRRCAA